MDFPSTCIYIDNFEAPVGKVKAVFEHLKIRIQILRNRDFVCFENMDINPDFVSSVPSTLLALAWLQYWFAPSHS